MDQNNSPYQLSIVATTRNDDHGGDMIERSTLFVKGLLHQCKKFQLRAELIIVEWNPPGDKPLLKDVFPSPGKDDLLTIKYIIVPKALHDKLDYSEKLPLFQMIAKNVGIRRAKSNFVLSTNIDLLFSDKLFRFLIENKPKVGSFYRCNRCDIPAEIDYSRSMTDQLLFAEKNVIKRLGKNPLYPYIYDATLAIFSIPFVGRLLSFYRKMRFFMMGSSGKANRLLGELDMNACGDFTLMAREDWEKIDGYAEFEAYSIHIDSLALISASAIGLKQVILPPNACSFHVSHKDGWEQADPIRKLYKDIERPMLDWSSVYQLAIHLLEKQEALKVNKPNWGFSDIELEEYIFEPQ